MKHLAQTAIAITAFLAWSSVQALIIVESGPTDSPANAQNIDAAFGFLPDQVIETNSNLDLGIPNATVFGFSGDGTYDYYSFTVGTGASPLQVGQEVFFDTDFAEIVGLDTHITLFDTDGTTVLDTNDDAPFKGPGDLGENVFNSFLSYIFDTSGEYFIRVGQFDGSDYGGVLSTDATYQLQVSTVPIPPAAWLFGSGVLALYALSRRRQTVKRRKAAA